MTRILPWPKPVRPEAMARSAMLAGCLALTCGGEQTKEAASGGSSGSGGSAGVDARFDSGLDAAPTVCDNAAMWYAKRIRVCVAHKVGPTYPPVDVTLSGPVLAAGNMSETSPCAESYWDTSGFWFEVADVNGESWVFGALIWGVTNPLTVGESVSVKASSSGGGFGPIRASLTLRDAAGEFIAYAGEGGDTPDLEPPDGISVTRGQPICTRNDSCGDWSAYDLEVTAPGSSKTVAYGTSENIGPYRVAHGGDEHQLPNDGGTFCPDWFVAHVAVGITPLP